VKQMVPRRNSNFFHKQVEKPQTTKKIKEE
jgi:hypothetical protein